MRDRLRQRDAHARGRRAERLGRLDRDGRDRALDVGGDRVGDAVGADVAEVEQHRQRIGPRRRRTATGSLASMTSDAPFALTAR